MGKLLIVYRNVPAFKEWPINFKLLLQALGCSSFDWTSFSQGKNKVHFYKNQVIKALM